MNSNSAKCGHIKRCINNYEPLKGKVLAFAIEIIEEDRNGEKDEILSGMTKNLKAGKALTQYERHIMLDVLLPKKKLNGLIS